MILLKNALVTFNIMTEYSLKYDKDTFSYTDFTKYIKSQHNYRFSKNTLHKHVKLLEDFSLLETYKDNNKVVFIKLRGLGLSYAT